MKPISRVIFVSLLVSACFIYGEGFTLKSPDISGQLSQQQVFAGFGCNGENISPQLFWENTPEGTKSFAVTVYDPDAPTGAGWWHWLIFNIPSDVTSLELNAGDVESGLAPEGSVQSVTSFGQVGFGGACPPEGDPPHAYVFTVYALSVESLDLDANATPSLVGFYLNHNLLAKASLIAYYSR